MNRNLFLQLLAHPDSVSEAENIALKRLTEDFPYCQTGQLLYVKHLHSQSSVHYPEQLKVAAAYSADRKILYHLIHSEIMEKELVGEEKSIVQHLSFKKEELEEITTPEIVEEKKDIQISNTPLDIIQKRLQEISNFKKEEPISPAVTEQVEVTVPEIVPFKEEIKTPEPTIVLQKDEEKPKEIIKEKKEEVLKSDKHSFTEWLKTIKKEPSQTKEAEKKSKPASSTDEIINRFIETEPRIVPSRTEFYSPVKMAKQSLEEHDDLVSETLAGIFAEQGNLKKAIEMYKKLMLLSPEKSSFFAARIEKLTQQLNSEK